MTTEETGASEQVEERANLDCFPIFQQFSRETLIEMVAQPWVSAVPDLGNVSRRASVTVELEHLGQRPFRVCPIAFCLWKEDKTWTEYDLDGSWYVAFNGSPDEEMIALELLGSPAQVYLTKGIEGIVFDEQEMDKFDTIQEQARDFIKYWDSGKITDLAAAACLTQSE